MGSGTHLHMKKVIRKTIRRKRDGLDLAADVNAVIAVNHGEEGGSTSASSTQRITQNSRVSARTGPRKATDEQTDKEA
jgi:hypothetical protein